MAQSKEVNLKWKNLILPSLVVVVLVGIIVYLGDNVWRPDLQTLNEVKSGNIEVNYQNGKFLPPELKVKAGTQVNFFNKSNEEVNLVSGSPGCQHRLEKDQSLGCLYKEAKTYIFENTISGAKGIIYVE